MNRLQKIQQALGTKPVTTKPWIRVIEKNGIFYHEGKEISQKELDSLRVDFNIIYRKTIVNNNKEQ
ncbi:MAG: hypothetical protein ACOC2M_02505 [bacterium]